MKKTRNTPRISVHWRRASGSEKLHLFLHTHEEYWSQLCVCGSINSRHSDEVFYYLPDPAQRCARCASAESTINRQLELRQKRPM